MFLQTFFQNVYFYLVFSFNVCRRKTMYFQRFKRFLTSELPKWSKRPICSFSHQCTFEPPFKKQMNSTCKFDSRKGEYNLQMAQMSRICPSYRDTRPTRRKRTGSLIDSSLALEKKKTTNHLCGSQASCRFFHSTEDRRSFDDGSRLKLLIERRRHAIEREGEKFKKDDRAKDHDRGCSGRTSSNRALVRTRERNAVVTRQLCMPMFQPDTTRLRVPSGRTQNCRPDCLVSI